MHGFCHLTYIPMRAEPSGKSEMVSQLIFGDSYKVLEEEGNWLRIINHFDNYHGWISATQFCEFDFEPGNSESRLVKSIFAEVENESRQYIPASASLFYENGNIFNGREWRSFTGESKAVEEIRKQKSVAAGIGHDAFKFLNTPYLWGGRTFMGIDCSGFTQAAYKMNGVSLPRDAYQQAEKGTTVNFVQEAKVGDLAFFDNEDGAIVHTGIILNDLRIIHAHGYVRIDRLDQHGIFNIDKSNYSHKLRIIKRIIPDN